jgi:hypothetical protein
VGGSLCHYGKKGMKWGVRKARDLYVEGLEFKRKRDKRDYIQGQIGNITKPSGGPADTYKKHQDNKRAFKAKDAKTAYRIAKQKAKNDPDYKNSSEYKSVVKEHGKQRTLEFLNSVSSAQKRY